jgi:hypothetical protein
MGEPASARKASVQAKPGEPHCGCREHNFAASERQAFAASARHSRPRLRGIVGHSRGRLCHMESRQTWIDGRHGQFAYYGRLILSWSRERAEDSENRCCPPRKPKCWPSACSS